MSRVAKKPVEIPAGVEIKIDGYAVEVKGPKGKEKFVLSDKVALKQTNQTIEVTATETSQTAKTLSGTARAIIANMVAGVVNGFERKLVLVGVGYRAQM